VSERRPNPYRAGDDASAAGSGIVGLSHVAIAVREADPLVESLVSGLGATRGGEELLDDGALRVVFVHLGPVTLELLEPRRADHTVARFLETRGPGLHHVSLEVSDLAAHLARAKAAGVKLIDESPRPGAHGSQVAFLHPKSLGGVLVELCQARRAANPGR
jgi:methylmalonyl-CoA/ethylmalonyl-CoA epimerase